MVLMNQLAAAHTQQGTPLMAVEEAALLGTAASPSAQDVAAQMQGVLKSRYKLLKQMRLRGESGRAALLAEYDALTLRLDALLAQLQGLMPAGTTGTIEPER